MKYPGFILDLIPESLAIASAPKVSKFPTKTVFLVQLFLIQ